MKDIIAGLLLMLTPLVIYVTYLMVAWMTGSDSVNMNMMLTMFALVFTLGGYYMMAFGIIERLDD